MSTTTWPVTQTADVAVNTATRNGADGSPSVTAHGVMSTSVATAIAAANPMGMMRSGEPSFRRSISTARRRAPPAAGAEAHRSEDSHDRPA